ncbi:MAG: Do family serine endopeptidase, partial [Pseudomonadales bacterium]|nr:Do family serine endopeptidase [Pseudomonadales bacterium]
MHRVASLAVVIFALTACSPQSSTAAPAAQDSRSSNTSSVAVPTAAPSVTAQALPDFAGLVERYGPAVVNVQVVEKRRTVQIPGMDEDNPFGEFFRRFGMPMPRNEDMPQARGEGSGFVVSADGYILTNAHVVADAEEVTVKMTDRREYTAKVIGADRRTDVALIKIDAKNLPVVKFGDPSKLRPGEWVVAIGSPFGFDHSVTAGIVSAVGRASYATQQQYVPFIQTDVAINRGNSGGPLLNTDGEVVGINSQIFSNTGGFMGVSFAIPIDVAMRSAEQLKEKGYVARGLLGVNIQEVTRDMVKSLGLAKPGGALVSGFSEDSAAKKAGVALQDVITAFDGKEVRSSADLPPMVGALPPGTKARLTVNRAGKTRDIVVTLGELPRDATAAASTGRDADDS